MTVSIVKENREGKKWYSIHVVKVKTMPLFLAFFLKWLSDLENYGGYFFHFGDL